MKATTISIIIATSLIGGVFVISNGTGGTGQVASVSNVSVVDSKQIITINAKGGYFPKVTIAKADMPTVIKVETAGTFDCSAALVIPSLNYHANLPPKGFTDIAVSAQKAGTKLQGLCAMGMYNFTINFE